MSVAAESLGGSNVVSAVQTPTTVSADPDAASSQVKTVSAGLFALTYTVHNKFGNVTYDISQSVLNRSTNRTVKEVLTRKRPLLGEFQVEEVKKLMANWPRDIKENSVYFVSILRQVVYLEPLLAVARSPSF